jgi:hypothetical protein
MNLHGTFGEELQREIIDYPHSGGGTPEKG